MINRLNAWIRDYFGFSRTETRGLFVLMSFVSIGLICSVYAEKYYMKTYDGKETDSKILDSLVLVLETQLNTEPTLQPSRKSAKKFLFDPNQASFKTLTELGISDKIATRIIKYRTKGGKFRQPEDLLKIYDFPPFLYEELHPYIKLAVELKKRAYTKVYEVKQNETDEKVTKVEVKHNASRPKDEAISLDINLADSLQLMGLKGIGKVLSSRIIKYREQLGGFHDMEQLQEVYHISDLALSSLKTHTYLQSNFDTKKIKINEADFKTLLSHPYINYELAKAIMNHRRIYGNFSSTEQLREVYFIEEELLVKLLPYIVI